MRLRNFYRNKYFFVILISYLNVANLKEETVAGRNFRGFVVLRKFMSVKYFKIGYPRKCMSAKFRSSTKVYVREIQRSFQIYNFSSCFEMM